MEQNRLKLLLDNEAFEDLFLKLKKHVASNRDGLAGNLDFNGEAELELSDMNIKFVRDVQMRGDNLSFEVVVSADIEVTTRSRYSYKDYDKTLWYSIYSSAIFDGKMQKFSVKRIEKYQARRSTF